MPKTNPTYRLTCARRGHARPHSGARGSSGVVRRGVQSGRCRCMRARAAHTMRIDMCQVVCSVV
eukprot:1341723-Prymnesium_polylepis.2